MCIAGKEDGRYSVHVKLPITIITPGLQGTQASFVTRTRPVPQFTRNLVLVFPFLPPSPSLLSSKTPSEPVPPPTHPRPHSIFTFPNNIPVSSRFVAHNIFSPSTLEVLDLPSRLLIMGRTVDQEVHAAFVEFRAKEDDKVRDLRIS